MGILKNMKIIEQKKNSKEEIKGINKRIYYYGKKI